MIGLTDKTVALIVILALSLVISAFRMAKYAGQYGYNPWICFSVSLFLTPFPVMIFFWCVYIVRRYKAVGSSVDELPQFKRRLKHHGQTSEGSEPE